MNYERSSVLIRYENFPRSLEQFLLTIGQNNFGNKIPIFCSVQSQENDNYDFELLLGSRELLRISHDDYYFPASYLLEHQYFSNFLKRTLRMFAIISKKYRIDIISFDMKFEH